MPPLGAAQGLVEEKETRSRELMKIMGLRAWPLAAAWWTTYTILFAAVAIAASLVLQPSVFPHRPAPMSPPAQTPLKTILCPLGRHSSLSLARPTLGKKVIGRL